MTWALAEAKNRFSEVFDKALREGPQRVSRRGKDEVIVMAASEFERLQGGKASFVDFLLSGPSFDDLDLERDRSPVRKVRL